MLDPSVDEIRDWGNSVIQLMIEYLGHLGDRPVYRQTSSRQIRSGLDSNLPIKGTDFDSARLPWRWRNAARAARLAIDPPLTKSPPASARNPRRVGRESSARAPNSKLATGRVRPTGGLDWHHVLATDDVVDLHLLRAVRRIVLSLNQLRGLTHAAFPSPTRDDLEL